MTKSAWAAIAVAILAVIGVVAVVGSFVAQVGSVEMSVGGWVAMILGILVTLALGVGLMALVFISSRRGYDEPGPRR